MAETEVRSINGRDISDNYSRNQLLNKIDKNKINDDGTGVDELWSASKVNAQFNTIVNEKASKQEVELERQRINNLATLGEGSTTGDAELIDARVGVDGFTYNNLGGAIRGQSNNFKNDIFQIYPFKIDTGTLITGKFIDAWSGLESTASDSKCSDFIEIETGYTLLFKNIALTGTRSIWCYDENKVKIQRLSVVGTGDTECTVALPSIAKYIRFTSLITQNPSIYYKDKILNDIKNVDNKTIEVNLKTEDISIKKSKIPYLNLQKYFFPSGFNAICPINIYTDGYRYITDFNPSDFKLKGGKTYYVSNKNISSNNGLSPETATSFTNAYNLATNGDTIVFLEGIYSRENLTWQSEITKSINVIGKGNVIIIDGNKPTFDKLNGYTNVYSASRSSATRVLDSKFGYDKIIAYQKKSSIAEVDSAKGSYYINGNIVYVNPMYDTTSLWVCVNLEKEFDMNNTSQNLQVYIENFTLIGKYTGIKAFKTTDSYTMNVCFNNVKTIYCGNDSNDSFLVYGANCVFNKCYAINSAKDGFNYSGILKDVSGTRTNCTIVEIDCIGAGCGHGTSYNTMNGTTAHNGAKVIRVNGKYYDTQGAPMADVQEGTQSVNLGCMVWTPKKLTEGEWIQGISAQQAGTEMWCENCISTGANGGDFYCVTGSTIHLNKCGYETKAGSGTFDETNKLSLFTALLSNREFLSWN